MKIIEFTKKNTNYINQAAELLVEGFKEHWPNAWPDLNAALMEVHEAFETGKINRIAIDEKDNLLGWIGAISQYNGNTWELHPLVTRKENRGKGVGRALVLDIEQQVRKKGGLSIFLGTDDENYMTSIAGIDLYPNVLDNLKNIKNIKSHPYEFYQKLGYSIVGVIPDANGFGKPDIIMSKRINKKIS